MPVIQSNDNDSGDSESEADSNDSGSYWRFEPTVPRFLSGSLTKSPTVPLDPQQPIDRMIFETLAEVVHFVYEYENRRGYSRKKDESERKNGMTYTSLLVVTI